MRKSRKSLVLTLCAAMTASLLSPAAASANTADTGDVLASQQVSDEFTDGITNFSFNLLHQLMNGDGNVLISPVSVAAILASAEIGASGETLSEMEQVLGSGMPADEFQEELASLLTSDSSSEEPTMVSSNAIMINGSGDSSLNEEFEERSRELFEPLIVTMPFESQGVDTANQWVKDRTDGMITNILDHLDPQAKMCLLNALLFKGEWEDQFEEYQIESDAEFTDADGSTSVVNMMVENMKTGSDGYYLPLNGGEGFVKPYQGEKYSFFAVLPPEDTDLAEFVNGIDGTMFSEAYTAFNTDKDVLLHLPEYSASSDWALSEAMQSLGIQRAFSGNAEFDHILESGEDLRISMLLQKAVLNLDRNGTYAAAATAGTMMLGAMAGDEKEQVEIFLDRPFLYGIVERSTGIPLFLGAVNSL